MGAAVADCLSSGCKRHSERDPQLLNAGAHRFKPRGTGRRSTWFEIVVFGWADAIHTPTPHMPSSTATPLRKPWRARAVHRAV